MERLTLAVDFRSALQMSVIYLSLFLVDPDVIAGHRMKLHMAPPLYTTALDSHP